jgi:hypothetical protein
LSLTVILASASMMGTAPESVVMLAVILPLQSFGGDYHAKRILCWEAAISIWRLLKKWNGVYTSNILLC